MNSLQGVLLRDRVELCLASAMQLTSWVHTEWPLWHYQLLEILPGVPVIPDTAVQTQKEFIIINTKDTMYTHT